MNTTSYESRESLDALVEDQTEISASDLIDMVANTSDAALAEVVKVGKTVFLRPTEKRARDRRRAQGRRANPKAARAKRLSIIKNKNKIKAGLRKFNRSAKGKAKSKDTGKFRKRFNAWVERLAPVLQIDERFLDQTAFEEMRLLSSPAFEDAEREAEFAELLDLVNEVIADGEDKDDAEIAEWYQAMAEEIFDGLDENLGSDPEYVEEDETEEDEETVVETAKSLLDRVMAGEDASAVIGEVSGPLNHPTMLGRKLNALLGRGQPIEALVALATLLQKMTGQGMLNLLKKMAADGPAGLSNKRIDLLVKTKDDLLGFVAPADVDPLRAAFVNLEFVLRKVSTADGQASGVRKIGSR
jgi:hypothetical protein